MNRPIASVIVPAYNESASIGSGLSALCQPQLREQIEVLVVANGCTDDTAEVARQASRTLPVDIRVLETEFPSKSNALRLGDAAAQGGIRVYLDADVRCPADTAGALIAAVSGDAELAVPSRELDLAAATPLVRLYYQTWQRLPVVEAELSGRGCYAFSEQGRQRFATFPDIVADDYWAVRQVPHTSAVVVPEMVRIRPPRTVRSLLRVRTRVYQATSDAPAESGPTPPSTTRYLVTHPTEWIGGAVFIVLSLIAKYRARRGQRIPLHVGRDAQRR